MSTLCPLPVLTNSLTSASLSHQVIRPNATDLLDPQSPGVPRVLGLERAGQQTAPLTAVPSTHSREGAMLLVACPPSAAARDSDGQPLPHVSGEDKSVHTCGV